MRRTHGAITGLVVAGSLLLSSCHGPLLMPGDGAADVADPGATPSGAPDVDVKGLATEIDRLERHIEKYGSVVPKHADVWGQARLMMHRQEFERVMRADINCFTATLQATIATSDQAYLASAFSLQAALDNSKLAVNTASGGGSSVTSLVSDPKDVIQRNTLTTQAGLGYAGAGGKLALEPTEFEDQKARFLDHLHALRRNNEGDDNTDAPGYALNLVRLPVSVLTGACTETGYGAECTFTATPHLTDDLLPRTFRNLVINDLASVLVLPVTKMVEADDASTLAQVAEFVGGTPAAAELTPEELPMPRTAASGADKAGQKPADSAPSVLNVPGFPPSKYRPQVNMADHLRAQVLGPSHLPLPARQAHPQLAAKADELGDRLRSLPSAAGALRRGKLRPLPPSQMMEALGFLHLVQVAAVVRAEIGDHLACKHSAYHLDVQSSLEEELNAAYDLLSSEQYRCLWDFCTPALVQAVHSRNQQVLVDMQSSFEQVVHAQHFAPPAAGPGKPASPNLRAITSALAWCVIVDAALLNARFLEDMQSAHAARGCPCPPPDGAPLYLPNPPPEVCRLFNDYVRCRWPVYVFALDPEIEEQNVGDSFRLRREMQLALSLAFTSGQIGANSFTRYVRRIEQDIDTIALNRTIIGFSHGDNTFGWRFYPRVQTPPIEGNLQTIFRDLLIGSRGPGYTLRRRRLENGIRECVALVIMPSFVPEVDLDAVSNWFRLNDPKCKALDLKDALRLSRTVQSIQECSALARDHDRYRPGDAGLVLRRLDQLSERLPLQHQLVSVPFENTHGGFELLSTGVTDLAPELIGWYGAPGINPNGDTTLFLVGDNFSVHQTRVIVGGRLLDSVCPVPCQVPCAAQCPDAAPVAVADCGCGKPAPAAPAPTPKMPPAAAAPPEAALPDAAEGAEVVQAAGLLPQLPHRTAPRAAAPASATTITNVLPAPAPNVTIAAPAPPPAPSAGGAPAPTAGAPPATTPPATPATPPAAPAPAPAPAAPPPAPCNSGCPTATSPAVVYQVELLSRQVMRVVIPKGVYSMDGLVDIHIATPYGVSPHLSVPVLCPTPAKPPAAAEGFSLDHTDLTISYCWQRVQPEKGEAFWRMRLTSAGPALKLTWKDATGKSLPFVTAAFKFPDFKVEQLLQAAPAAEGSDYPIGAALLAGQLLDKLNQPVGTYDPNRPPDAVALTTAVIEVTPMDGRDKAAQVHAVKAVTATNNLTVHFKLDPEAAKRGCCPPVPCPPAPAMPKVDDTPGRQGPAVEALPPLSPPPQ